MTAELAENKPDVLVGVTPVAALAAKQETSTVPIVFVAVHDPVRSKLVDNLAHPGGNITGLTHITVELSSKRLALFKEAIPRMSRVAFLVNTNDQQSAE